MKTKVKANSGLKCPSIIGRECILRDLKQAGRVLVGGIVIDKMARTNKAKRIRLTTGEAAGEVRMLGEYEVVEFCERGEAPGFLAAAWV